MNVLCVCTMGYHRSRTLAEVINNNDSDQNIYAIYRGEDNTTDLHMEQILKDADMVITMDRPMLRRLKKKHGSLTDRKIPFLNLAIPDIYEYNDPELVKLLYTLLPEDLHEYVKNWRERYKEV